MENPNLKQSNAIDKEQQIRQEIQVLENAVRPYLTKEAYERYARVKMAHPKNAVEAIAHVAEMIQQGKMRRFEDKDLKEILAKLIQKKDFTIKRG